MPKKTVFDSNERINVALRLQGLSEKKLELNTDPLDRITLDLGHGLDKNAVEIQKKNRRVSLYTENPKLLDDSRDAGFRVTERDQNYLFNKNRYWINNVGLDEIDRNESLFRALVKGSVEAKFNRRSKKQ